MYENQLYPIEIIDVMRAVLAGDWDGPDPEVYIDQLLIDFFSRVEDKRSWSMQIADAVKQLGCLDCVFARLNLECLLDADEGDAITIRFDRQRYLPGENHNIGCQCRLCIGNLLTMQNSGKVITNAHDNLEIAQIPEAISEQGMAYPEDTDELERQFYSSEQVYKRARPRPTISAERKVEILDHLRQMGYELADSRNAAYERLEKLLHKRSLEQNLVGRLCYLILFEAFKQLDGRKFLINISPCRPLLIGFGK